MRCSRKAAVSVLKLYHRRTGITFADRDHHLTEDVCNSESDLFTFKVDVLEEMKKLYKL